VRQPALADPLERRARLENGGECVPIEQHVCGGGERGPRGEVRKAVEGSPARVKVEMRALKGCAQRGRRWTTARKASACAGRRERAEARFLAKCARRAASAARPEVRRREAAGTGSR